MTLSSFDIPPDPLSTEFPVVATADGSITFFSAEFGQAFHNLSGAYQEALAKFVLPCQLDQKPLQQPRIQLLDICFGLGYNSGVALETIWRVNPQAQVALLGLERSPEVPLQAWQQGVGREWGFAAEWGELVQTGSVRSDRLAGTLLWGDARQRVAQVPLGWADAVFLDPFSPSVCPELWTVEFLSQVAQRMQPSGNLCTYSCSAAVRTALLAAGFQIGSTPAIGRPWPGTIAAFSADGLPPLSRMEQEHLQTRAAIPYRDPGLELPRPQILLDRQQAQQRSGLEATSRWKARWAVTDPG